MDRPERERGDAEDPAAVERVSVGTHLTYAEAERAVDHLSDRHFPVERTMIVGQGLRSVERVTGRVNTLRAGANSALTGAALGALLGWIFGVFDWVNPLIAGLLLAFYGMVAGAVLGFIAGLVAHALTRGQRDFSSVAGIEAESYDVYVEAAYADEAIRLLGDADAPDRDGDRTTVTG